MAITGLELRANGIVKSVSPGVNYSRHNIIAHHSSVLLRNNQIYNPRVYTHNH